MFRRGSFRFSWLIMFSLRFYFVYGDFELREAAYDDDFDKVKCLLDNGHDPNSTCELIAERGQWTPLHWAVYRGNVGMTEILLKANAEVNCKNDRGEGVMHVAIMVADKNATKDRMIIIRMLLEKNCHMRALNDMTESLIHYVIRNMKVAPEKGNVDILDAIVWRGAFGVVNSRMYNGDGYTPVETMFNFYRSRVKDRCYLSNYLVEMGWDMDSDIITDMDKEVMGTFLEQCWPPARKILLRDRSLHFDDVAVDLIKNAYGVAEWGEEERSSTTLKTLTLTLEKDQMFAVVALGSKYYKWEDTKNRADVTDVTIEKRRTALSDIREEIYESLIRLKLPEDDDDILAVVTYDVRKRTLLRLSWNLFLAARILEKDVTDAITVGLELAEEIFESKKIYFQMIN